MPAYPHAAVFSILLTLLFRGDKYPLEMSDSNTRHIRHLKVACETPVTADYHWSSSFLQDTPQVSHQ